VACLPIVPVEKIKNAIYRARMTGRRGSDTWDFSRMPLRRPQRVYAMEGDVKVLVTEQFVLLHT
jgi:hypothetical protein